MSKLIKLADTVGGSQQLVYTFPESLGKVRLRTIVMGIVSGFVGNLDIILRIMTSERTLKGVYPVPNTVAAHNNLSRLSWGGVGAYYLVAAPSEDFHQIPMQGIVVEGGDILQVDFNGFAGSFVGETSIWVDLPGEDILIF